MSYQTDEEMVTCDNCGNTWDGYAQCMCLGIPDYYSDSEEEKEKEQNTSTHPMTLRSHTRVKENEESEKNHTELQEEELELMTHPECWNAHTHYGQCGQSCPCCRAIVGDTWGACLICSKN